ncbi:MAG: hypothetical protein LBV16_06085 [Elusimicrobiota bacterium]|jgi:hypothetical protein|nr:hypothetical protein [Elusimicrobiota bacterium]
MCTYRDLYGSYVDEVAKMQDEAVKRIMADPKKIEKLFLATGVHNADGSLKPFADYTRKKRKQCKN